MKVGVHFAATKEMGGIYQYSVSFLEALKCIVGYEFVVFNTSVDFPKEYKNFFTVIDFVVKKTTCQNSQGLCSAIKRRIVVFVRGALLFFRGYTLLDRLHIYLNYRFFSAIQSTRMDLMIFIINSPLAYYISTPTINIVYDLQHRLNPQFPEVSKKGISAFREFHFKKITKTSRIILVDSEIGKEDLLDFYQFDSASVHVLPFLPPDYLQEHMPEEHIQKLLHKLQIPSTYFFYPAQFWPHKNHIILVKAVEKLKQRGVEVSVVFCGSKKKEWGVYDAVISYAKEHNMQDHLMYLGYVDNETISALYKRSVALVMPTFFGPTNIPVLEAWKMNTPVIYSDIRGCREQLGDAGLLIDPTSADDVADKMEILLKDAQKRIELVEKGKLRLNIWGIEEFSKKIQVIIKNATYGS